MNVTDPRTMIVYMSIRMSKPSAVFEALTRSVLSRYYGVALYERLAVGLKKFDLVSGDSAIMGDAKYFTMVNGNDLPPAKLSVIAEHVWLLEKSTAQHRFLVFGNDSRVAACWLRRFGRLTSAVRFFFVDETGLREYDRDGMLGPAIAHLVEDEAAIWARLKQLDVTPRPLITRGSIRPTLPRS